MIVTRQRKQKKSPLPILLPIAAIVMLVIALTWPPSRGFIANGPLKPAVTVFDGVWGTVSRPLSFAYQQQQLTDRNRDIKTLNDKLETDRKAAAGKDTQIAALQKQVAAGAGQPSPSPSPGTPLGRPAAPSAAVPGAAAPGAAAAPAAGADAIHRNAQQWSAMDPEKAAALVQKLPTGYVATVFAQMSPDSVGPIMDALPANVAALIVENGNGPQISAQTSR